MEGWVPIPDHELDISREEFSALLRDELTRLSPDLRQLYERYAIDPIRAPQTWDWGEGPRTLPVWIIARHQAEVVGYDEVEDEYGAGILGPTGVTHWGTYGERLARTLQRFPTATRTDL